MKYKLTNETQQYYWITLHRIEALKDFGNVKKGDKGGWIEKKENLSQTKNAWVYGDAWVSGDARVSGNASVSGYSWVSGNAKLSGDFRLQNGRCFARKQADWNVTEVNNGDGILLIKDYIPIEKDTHTLILDGKEIELSEESYQEFKKQFE